MRTCYLHLGMPKTGSTSIQKAFFGYEDNDLAYAKLPKRNHETIINMAFSSSPQDLPIAKRREMSGSSVGEMRARSIEQIEEVFRSDKSVIFSGEAIIDQLSKEDILTLLESLKKNFERVVPIIYVRPLATLVASQFQQRVKMGLGSFSLPHPKYRERLQPVLENEFVDDPVLVRFDRQSLLGGDVVADFAERVGAGSIPERADASNESLSTEAIGALYGFNKYASWQLNPKARTQMLREMIRGLQGVGRLRFGFGRALVERHLDQYESDVAWIERYSGFDVRGTISTVEEPIESEEHLLTIAEAASRTNQKAFRRNVS